MKFSLLILSSAIFCSVLQAQELHLGQGQMSGEVTATSVHLQTRLTAQIGLDEFGDLAGIPGVVSFEYSPNADFSDSKKTAPQKAIAANDFIVRSTLDGLTPDTTYHYRSHYGADEASITASPKTSAVGTFTTHPGASSSKEVTFILGSCMNYMKFIHGVGNNYAKELHHTVENTDLLITATQEDKKLGYPVFPVIASHQPDFFIGSGDIVYYDHTLRVAKTLPELRKCWHEQFRFPRLIEFFAQTPCYWSKDDHDFRYDNSDLTTEELPLPQTGIDLFREQLPIVSQNDKDDPTYRTHRVSKHLQIWIPEGRDYRSPNESPDGPNKTIWGKEQRAWLQKTLKESDATWKIIVNPSPFLGPDDSIKIDNHASLGGFQHEIESFFQWLAVEQVTGVYNICGDRHWQYHSIHPNGFEEFACGALNDENSRIGAKPFSPTSSDPDGIIHQPFSSPERSGGFLKITADQQLLLQFYNDENDLLYQTKKKQPRALKKSSP